MSSGPSKYRFLIYTLVAIGILAASWFAYVFVYRYPIWTLRAFRVPSSSMCPTICDGDHIFVRMRLGTGYSPARGDVIAFEHGEERVSFIKRVVGLPGDLVAWGPGNSIRVNGQAWVPPPACVKPPLPPEPDSVGYRALEARWTRVPPGQLFVIGDNLNNSYDSRIEGFAPVSSDRVFGNPVLIYLSPHTSRIGCPIH